MNRINEFKQCPICKTTKYLTLSDERSYNKSFRYQGETGCVSLMCWGCYLQLFAHSREANGTLNYQILVGKLKEKWNRIPRKEQ